MNSPGLSLTTLALVTVVIACTVALPARADAQRRSAQAATGSADPSARRGATDAPRESLTSVFVSLGSARYDARVDAHCHIDERAAPGNTRAHFVVMYPWFGQRPPANQPQWHLNFEIRRSASADAYDQFTFSFQDGPKSGIIQTVAGSQRMGSGTVRVTQRGRGARFDVKGRSSQGETLRATIDCPVFQKSEGVSG